MIEFTVYVKPEPQGSSKGFPIRRADGKMGVSITSANKALKPFRHAVAEVAYAHALPMPLPWAAKHIPVWVDLHCFLQKPGSAPKKRRHPVVKPDVDKLARAILDALTGILWADDAQVVELRIQKHYGVREHVDVSVGVMADEESTTEDNPKAFFYGPDFLKDSEIPF